MLWNEDPYRQGLDVASWELCLAGLRLYSIHTVHGLSDKDVFFFGWKMDFGFLSKTKKDSASGMRFS